jgi:hypothetical protein
MDRPILNVETDRPKGLIHEVFDDDDDDDLKSFYTMDQSLHL